MKFQYNLYLFSGLITLLICVIQSLIIAQTWQSNIVHYGTNNKLVYVPDNVNNIIPDFSYAGYKNGVVTIPYIPVVDSVNPVAGDNTTNIQNAINRVASLPLINGFRGALLMKAGRRYWVSKPLNLNASGVVLRGVGEGSDSTLNTIIYATGDSLNQPVVLIAGGGNTGSNSSAWSGSLTSNINIISDSVHVGERTFQVADPGPFSVGDNIVIVHPKTTAWLRAVNWGGVPNDTGVTSYWAGQNIPIIYNRYITSITGNTITIDAPVFTTLVRTLSQCYIYKTNRNNILTNIGIEKLRIDIINPFGQSPATDGDEQHHAATAIWLGKIEDAWVKHCTTLHFSKSGIKTSIATRVTIDSCASIDPISIIDGERRYNFDSDFASQLIIFSNCYASYGRHAFVVNGTSGVSGIVFYKCTSERSFNLSEGHRIWSQGLLYDNYIDKNRSNLSKDALGLYNRGDMGSGHGWAAVHSVAWNCNAGTANIIIQKPPAAQNYAIGCFGGQITGIKPPAPFNQPQGYIEGSNTTGLYPVSLYNAQLNDRGQVPELNLKMLIQGFFNGTTMLSDTVTVELRNPTTPYTLVESKKIVLDISGAGTGKFFSVARGVPYYIVIKHRNAIETWSASPQWFTDDILSYDFTSAQNKAYGNNVTLEGTKWCIFSGDVNQDGLVDGNDIGAVDNDNNAFVSGYLSTDLNGDGIVDGTDLGIADNSNNSFVSRIVPPGAPGLINMKQVKPLIFIKVQKSIKTIKE